MQNDIFTKIETAQKPDFGGILSKSFDLFKLIWKDCLYHGLISMAVALPFLILVYAPLMPLYIDMIEASINGYNVQPDMNYSVGWYIGYTLIVFGFAIMMQIIGIGIAAHFYRVLKKHDLQTDENPGGYFIYLKEHFGKIVLLTLATTGISLVAIVLCYFPIFYVMVPLQLVLPIFAFNKRMSVGSIIKAAFKLGNRFWLIIFGLAILSSMIAQIGVIACFVGVFVTAYFVHIPMYYVYKDTIGFDDTLDAISQTNEITQQP